jgi:hypothetical protein
MIEQDLQDANLAKLHSNMAHLSIVSRIHAPFFRALISHFMLDRLFDF